MSGSDRRAELDAGLKAFRAGHPPRTLEWEGVVWRYYRGGTGEPALLLLTGELGIAEFGFEVAAALERRFTVIMPDYPPVADAERFLDGLLAILDAEQIGRVVLHGGSFGGLLVQRLAERAPNRVTAIILSHTGPVEGARIPRWALALSEALPNPWFLSLLKRRLGGLIRNADPFWISWFDDVIQQLGKPAMMARFRLATALAGMSPGSPPARWKGPTLIVESDDDPAVRPAQRDALGSRYPGARTHRFAGTGHVAAVLQPIQYADVISQFVESVENSKAPLSASA